MDVDEDIVQVVKAVPRRVSWVLELADGSDDGISIEGDTEIDVDTDVVESGDESETAEDELGK